MYRGRAGDCDDCGGTVKLGPVVFAGALRLDKCDDFRATKLDEILMPFVDVSHLKVTERLPGWFGKYFHSASMTFAHYDFRRGASIHEHFHPQEEVYEVIEGELELTIDGVSDVVRPGLVAIVPSNARHSVKALTDGRAIIVDFPARREFQ